MAKNNKKNQVVEVKDFASVVALIGIMGDVITDKNSIKSRVLSGTKAVITELQTNSVKLADAFNVVRVECEKHDSWPVFAEGAKVGQKKGENGARGTAAGNAYNTIATTLRQSYKADENGHIIEKTKEEKADERKATVEANKEKAEEAKEKMRQELLQELNVMTPMELAAKLSTVDLVAMLVLNTGSKEAALQAVKQYRHVSEAA